MRLRPAALVFAALLAVAASAGPALAAGNRSAHLSLSAATTTVSGSPVAVNVRLTDAAGKPVGGALIRLVTTVTFMGADHEEIVDEGTTDAAGRTVLTFAPSATGTTTVTARYTGSAGSPPAEASLAFDVQAPIVAYHPAPVGLQAPWARSYLILLPVLGVWFTYLLVIAQARKIRRAGFRRPAG